MGINFQVTDTNDNAPAFQATAYSFDVPEDVEPGSQIGRVVATDADADGPSSQLSYALISDWANDVFSLNPNTGVFTLTATLDYEQVRIRQKGPSIRQDTSYGIVKFSSLSMKMIIEDRDLHLGEKSRDSGFKLCSNDKIR